jgi:hypothetical protein
MEDVRDVGRLQRPSKGFCRLTQGFHHLAMMLHPVGVEEKRDVRVAIPDIEEMLAGMVPFPRR